MVVTDCYEIGEHTCTVTCPTECGIWSVHATDSYVIRHRVSADNEQEKHFRKIDNQKKQKPYYEMFRHKGRAKFDRPI